MGWSVERDPDGKVVICADYVLLDDNGAVALAEAIWAVAHHRIDYIDEWGETVAVPSSSN
jgi:hypothetical protein